MRSLLSALILTIAAAGCGVEDGASEAMQLSVEDRGVSGSWVSEDGVVLEFQSTEVEPGLFEVSLQFEGLVLDGLLEPEQGIAQLDGFAAEDGSDTQILEEDRALISGLYGALNDHPTDGLPAAYIYLRRSVGVWGETPSRVELARVVLGEEGRGYTRLCSYAKCDGSYTKDNCGTNWNWYTWAEHDCWDCDWDDAGCERHTQVGDHYRSYCQGYDELIWWNQWYCASDPDHWPRTYTMGLCMGRCGEGCGGDNQYTKDCTNHDDCVRNGHNDYSLWCDDQFASSTDDELFSSDCY